jgi:regulatory protein YycI of two-component signal transduction system YycFG
MNNENPPRNGLKTAIVLIVAVLVSLVFLMYAFVQKAEADKQRQIAVEQARMAEQMQQMAVTERQLAEKRYQEALKVIAEKDSIINTLRKK